MPSILEAPAFVAPMIGVGDEVLFNNGSNLELWFPAVVTRVGQGSAGPAIEVIVTAHDGGGVQGSDRGAANIAQFARDNVKHIDDPEAKTEQYQVHVIGDNEGGYWKLTESDTAARARLDDMQAQIDELRKGIVSRTAKSNQN